MSNELKRLYIQQSFTANKMKQILTYFKKFPPLHVTRRLTRQNLMELEKHWAKYYKSNLRIVKIATPDEKSTSPYFVNDEFKDTENMFNEASDFLYDIHSILAHSSSDSETSSDSDSSSSDDCELLELLALPRIKVPKFSGSRLQWEKFSETFESLVANNESLSDVQKLRYLKISVVGEARKLIKHVRNTGRNYEIAWNILLQEYSNISDIINIHLHAFMDLPVMQTENAADLMRLRDAVSDSLAALSKYNRPIDKWDDLLIFIVTQKFSSQTRVDWNVTCANVPKCPTYKELEKFMTNRIHSLTDK